MLWNRAAAIEHNDVWGSGITLQTDMLMRLAYRSMAHPPISYCPPQNLLRYNSRRLPRDVMDADKHFLHVWVVPDVPLRARRSF